MYQQYQEVKRDIKNLLKESFPFTLYPSIPSEGRWREGEREIETEKKGLDSFKPN